MMWDRVGLIRTGDGLWEARNALIEMEPVLRRTISGRHAGSNWRRGSSWPHCAGRSHGVATIAPTIPRRTRNRPCGRLVVPGAVEVVKVVVIEESVFAPIVAAALAEDLGEQGDIASLAIIGRIVEVDRPGDGRERLGSSPVFR